MDLKLVFKLNFLSKYGINMVSFWVLKNFKSAFLSRGSAKPVMLQSCEKSLDFTLINEANFLFSNANCLKSKTTLLPMSSILNSNPFTLMSVGTKFRVCDKIL